MITDIRALVAHHLLDVVELQNAKRVPVTYRLMLGSLARDLRCHTGDARKLEAQVGTGASLKK